MVTRKIPIGTLLGACLLLGRSPLAGQVIVISGEKREGKAAPAEKAPAAGAQQARRGKAVQDLRAKAERIEGFRILPPTAKDQVLYELGRMPRDKREAYLEELGGLSLDGQKMKIHVLIQSALDEINRQPTPERRTKAWKAYRERIRKFLAAGGPARKPKRAAPGDIPRRLEQIRSQLARIEGKLDRLLRERAGPKGAVGTIILRSPEKKEPEKGEEKGPARPRIEIRPEPSLCPKAIRREAPRRLILQRVERPRGGKRGFLGISAARVAPELAGKRGLPAGKGVLVDRVVPGSPACRARLREGDLVLAIDGRVIDSFEQLAGAVSGKGGEAVELLVVRAGRERRIEAIRVKLGTR